MVDYTICTIYGQHHSKIVNRNSIKRNKKKIDYRLSVLMTSAVPELADLVRLIVNEVLHGAQRVLALLVPKRTLGTEPVFVNLLRSPGIHSLPCAPVRQPYLLYRDRIFKLLRSPGIDSKVSIPPAYVAWWAGTTTLFLLGS